MFKVEFLYNGQIVVFSERGALSIYQKVLEWLYKNGYKFTGQIHESELT